ncbi:hypothetical protein Tco_0629558 [Tanacetum coccineum]|uniref:Reverse transcriptase domain-containing protein n=1 Tax=Tanacetum coccineum TaxID=301880 RepID=A0ABQ4WTI8_9ASTR
MRRAEPLETIFCGTPPPPHPTYRITARMSIRPQAPASFLSEEDAESPTYIEAPPGFRAAGIRQRDTPPSLVHLTEIPKICLPLCKRPWRTTPTPGYKVTESLAAGVARQDRPAVARANLYGFVDMEATSWYSHWRIHGRTGLYREAESTQFVIRDRPYHMTHSLILTEEDAIVSRVACAQLIGCQRQEKRSEGMSLCALTWWNSHVMTVGHDVAYAMTWTDLKKKMMDKYCPRNEMKKLELEL